jgi:hypothetical protein
MKATARCRITILGIVVMFVASIGPGAAAQSGGAPNKDKASQNAGPGGGAAKQVSPLKIAEPKTLVLDPACNACDGATITLTLHNGEPGRTATGKGEPLELRAGPLMSDDKEPKTANARTSIEPTDKMPPLPKEIKAGDSIAFQVKVKGVLAPGNWKAKIYNGDTDLGEATFTLPAVTMNVKVDGVDANAPAITLTRGEATPLVLKNDDPKGYQILWDFRFGSGGATDKTEDKIPGSSSKVLKLTPKEEWFGEGQTPACSWLGAKLDWLIPCNRRAIFKDKEADGLLEVRLAAPGCANDAGAPVKLIHVKTTLAYYGPNRKAFWSYAVTLFLLFAGAVLSLYVNYKLPDEQIRGELRQQWKEIGKGIGDLSMKLAVYHRLAQKPFWGRFGFPHPPHDWL